MMIHHAEMERSSISFLLHVYTKYICSNVFNEYIQYIGSEYPPQQKQTKQKKDRDIVKPEHSNSA